MDNRLKRYVFIIITWAVFFGMSWFIYLFIRDRVPTYSVNDAQSVTWAWASLIMGLLLGIRLRKWVELLWGSLLFAACLLPTVGVLIGLVYFYRCYGILFKK